MITPEAEGPSRAARTGRGRVGRLLQSVPLSGAAYLALYLALSWKWIARARTAAAVGFNAADEPLVVWILGWVRQALVNRPTGLFDAPINHPAPLQLAGSEHLLSFQLLFAPLHAIFGEDFLAANVTVLSTYPLAALAMQRLLLALGCSPTTSFVVGLAYPLGPMQVPASPHVLQYSSLFLPVVILRLLRLRERPGAGSAAALFVATLLAFLASNYTALLTGGAALLFGLGLSMSPAPGRVAYLRWASLAASLAIAAFAAVSLPYFEYRAMVIRPTAMQTMTSAAPGKLLALDRMAYAPLVSWMHLRVLAGAAAVAWLLGPSCVRRVATMGLVFLALGTVVGLGVLAPHGGLRQLPGLFFFRYGHRAALYTGFGGALALAAALEVTRARIGRTAATVLSVALCVFVLGSRGMQFRDAAMTTFVDAPAGLVPEIRRVVAAHGRGPLLELPRLRPLSKLRPGGTEAPSMVLALEHGLPLIVGHTGYEPRHLRAISPLIPPGSTDSLQRLVDATGLRWILLQPWNRWPVRDRLTGRALLELPATVPRLFYEGWVLLEVRLRPRDDRWIRAIDEGAGWDETAFGTPLAPLPPSGQQGSLSIDVAPEVVAGARALVRLRIANLGDAVWPGIPFRRGDQSPNLVRLRARWRPLDEAGRGDSADGRGAGEILDLKWDIVPGGTLATTRSTVAPEAPGRYELEVRIGQGSAVEQPLLGVPAARRIVEVLPAGPAEPSGNPADT